MADNQFYREWDCDRLLSLHYLLQRVEKTSTKPYLEFKARQTVGILMLGSYRRMYQVA